MGVDCSIKVKDKYINLDRWYCFADLFKSGESYTAEQITEKTKELYKNKDAGKYTGYWLGVLDGVAGQLDEGETLTIYNENDLPDEYWGDDET